MKKLILVLAALLLTAGLIYQGIGLWKDRSAPAEPHLRLVRVWIGEKEPSLSGWLKKMAARYEKQTETRVFLRSVSEAEAQAALSGNANDPIPDLLVLSDVGKPIALRGFALIVRDDSAQPETPQPTSALFFRPSPSPGPSASPAPEPNLDMLRAVLVPPGMADRMPGAVISADPAAEFAQGKADAALLTAGQAARLPFGFRFFALPEGKGFLSVGATAFFEAGDAFLSFLLAPGCQQTLRDTGLFSPVMHLYSPDDPIRYLIDTSHGSPF